MFDFLFPLSVEEQVIPLLTHIQCITFGVLLMLQLNTNLPAPSVVSCDLKPPTVEGLNKNGRCQNAAASVDVKAEYPSNSSPACAFFRMLEQ